MFMVGRIYTPKSGFIQMLAHLWNDCQSKEPHFVPNAYAFEVVDAAVRLEEQPTQAVALSYTCTRAQRCLYRSINSWWMGSTW